VNSEAARIGLLHNLELWVPDLSTARPRWHWLFGSLGYEQFQSWDNGVSYRLGPTYIVLEQSPALIEGSHQRAEPGSTTSPSTPDPALTLTNWFKTHDDRAGT